MSADLETSSPDEVSRESEGTALRQALIEGENGGEAVDLDIRKIKAKARQ